MPGGYGRRVDAGRSLGRVDKPLKPQSAGSYRTADRAPDGAGGTVYPTVLEAYNRDSDYKRWRAGFDYWQGSGKGWSDVETQYLVRSFRDFGTAPGARPVGVTYFPSSGSPDASWAVTCRRRGAFILPGALQHTDLRIEALHPSPGQHRLILDVSSRLSSEQLKAWDSLIGDQFEDSATGPDYPHGLLNDPIDTVAYTLVSVDHQEGALLFDLSRPYVRVRPNAEVPRAFWRKLSYNRRLPLAWRADGTRHLCSSHRFYCSCPDFSGSATASLQGGPRGGQALFPRPSAGRGQLDPWERENVGYLRRWRDLPLRIDERRECKHIHAARWSAGYPFYEPSDYVTGGDGQLFAGSAAGSVHSAEVAQYHRERGLTLDRLAPGLADCAGLLLDAGSLVSPDPQAPAQPGRKPVLWTTSQEPTPDRAVVDDWWLEIGTATLRVFNPGAQRFVDTTTVGGESMPVIERVGTLGFAVVS